MEEMRSFGQLTAAKKRGGKKVTSEVSSEAPSKPSAVVPASFSNDPEVSVEKLRAMAKSLGVEISVKRNWTKHTYTVTQENKELFEKYCSRLDIKMQDAMEEAMSDWFKKRKSEYDVPR